MIFGPDISFEIPVRVCLLNGFAPGGRQTRFFEEHVRADEIHGAKGFAIVQREPINAVHISPPAIGSTIRGLFLAAQW